MDPIVAVLDACVLYPAFLRDFLVRLAIHGRNAGVLRVKWTGRIHREWIRAVLRQKPNTNRKTLLRTRSPMDQHVRGCRVKGYERWEQRLTLPDENDRHVLACVANAIVTFNLRDFPPECLNTFGVEAITPDVFVTRLAQRDEGLIPRVAEEHRLALKNPPMTPADYVESLKRNHLPTASALLAEKWR